MQELMTHLLGALGVLGPVHEISVRSVLYHVVEPLGSSQSADTEMANVIGSYLSLIRSNLSLNICDRAISENEKVPNISSKQDICAIARSPTIKYHCSVVASIDSL